MGLECWVFQHTPVVLHDRRWNLILSKNLLFTFLKKRVLKGLAVEVCNDAASGEMRNANLALLNVICREEAMNVNHPSVFVRSFCCCSTKELLTCCPDKEHFPRWDILEILQMHPSTKSFGTCCQCHQFAIDAVLLWAFNCCWWDWLIGNPLPKVNLPLVWDLKPWRMAKPTWTCHLMTHKSSADRTSSSSWVDLKQRMQCRSLHQSSWVGSLLWVHKAEIAVCESGWARLQRNEPLATKVWEV